MVKRSASQIGAYGERRAAKDLEGERTRVKGLSIADVIDKHGNKVEVKYRKDVPDWLKEIFFSTREEVDYAVLYIKGQKDGLVVHRLSEFKKKGLLINLPEQKDISWDD